MRLLQRLPIRCFAAAALLAALVLLHLARPIGDPGHACLSSAGLLQDFPLTRIEPPAQASGRPRFDALVRTEPWAIFERTEFAGGRAPVWNPWNAAGHPHLACADTAAFSPFAVPLHLLQPRAGRLASAAMALFALGFLAFLFLRELRTGTLAALVGATSFAFAGAHLPALGTFRAGALATLPAALFFAEKALARVQAVALGRPGEQRLSARVRAPLAGLCLSLVAGSLCGDAGAIALAVSVLAVWVGARMLSIAFQARASGRSLRPLAGFGAKLALALILAGGILAFEILPVLELLRHGTRVPGASSGVAPLEWGPWPLLFFPRALGEPHDLEEVAAYVGGIVLFLALFSLVFLRKDPRIPFFLAIGVICIAAASGIAPLSGKLADWGLVSAEQGQGGFAFCIACAAALAIDRITKSETSHPWSLAASTAAGGILFLASFRFGMESFLRDPVPTPHLRHMAELFAAGLVAVCLLWVARDRRLRLLAGAALVSAIFLGTGPGIADLLPRCEERALFPSTPAIQKLQARIGRDRIVVLGEDGIPAESNLVYGVAVLTSPSGLAITEFARSFRASFGGAEVTGPIPSVSARALQMFGVRWVLARGSSELSLDPSGTFELVERIGEFGLYRRAGSPGKAWVVRGSTPAHSLGEAWDLVQADSFDPARAVVLGPDAEGPSAVAPDQRAAARARDTVPKIVEETPAWVRIEADCNETEFLVVAQTWYPGWKARVNGIERPLWRANYAFSAVELQRGLNVVDLSYEPQSLHMGLWIGLACALGGLLCLFHRATG